MRSEAAEPELAEVGKISEEIFEDVIKPRLGSYRSEVLVGPRHGVDVGIVDIGAGRVMALTTDPFFVVPDYGWERAAWFAVHIVASDASTSGLQPAYLTVDLNLPLTMTRDELEMMWHAVDATCREIGLAVVTGHTGRYDGCDYPMLGGATVISIGNRDAYITPTMARVGDTVVITKGAAIEAAALFGVSFPHHIAAVLGPESARAAEALFYQMSVVKDAMTAVEIGVREAGVTSMHDATERGVWNGLCEIAAASRVGMVVDRDAVVVPPVVQAVCDLFGIDPYTSSSEGTLILTCRPHRLGALLDRLADGGIPAYHLGEITPVQEGVRVVQDGIERPLLPPLLDPFWPAFRRAMEEHPK